jgi:nucleotide-binding universal stress UspA family protein
LGGAGIALLSHPLKEKTMTHTIVVGVDGSDRSLSALAAAADLAEHTGSELSVIFVHDPGAAAVAATYDGSAAPFLERAIDELEVIGRERTFDLLAHRRLEWTFDVAIGEAAHELIDVATTRAASLIVVGGRSHSLLGGLVLGSVAQKLVRSSPISVLVVRQPEVTDYQLAELHASAS